MATSDTPHSWSLPVTPPLAPMLAKAVPEIPRPDSVPGGMHYEPKWDGFRCILFREGSQVELTSRSGRPLTRYFPELVEQALVMLPERCVIDGEIVLIHHLEKDSPQTPRLDFDALQQRLHPAASRVAKLAAETPARYVAFDLLAVGTESLIDQPLTHRRRRLESLLAADAHASYTLTPTTTDLATAQHWFEVFEGAGLDGVVAKPLQQGYQPDKRAMFKIKHSRTADCVVAGFRWHKTGDVVGSLLLGLYHAGRLQHVGVAGSFPMTRRRELVAELAPYRCENLAGHPWGEWASAATDAADSDRMPGGQSRWSVGKDLSWVALRPELVCEVSYEHMEGDRFRHLAHFRHWRSDRTPQSCTYEQLEVPLRFNVEEVLSGSI